MDRGMTPTSHIASVAVVVAGRKVQETVPQAPTETDLPLGWAHFRSAPSLSWQMGVDLSFGVAKHQNSLPPHSVAAAVVVAVAVHAHIEAGSMEAWPRPLLVRPNRFSWLMMMTMMMHALRTTIGGSGSDGLRAVLRAGG